MSQEHFPKTTWLAGRRAWEKTISLSVPVLRSVAGIMAALLLALAFVGLSVSGLSAVLVAIALTWTAAAAVLIARFFRKPSEKDLAKRADKVLGLQDDLLALSELPASESAGEWRTATWRQAQRSIESGKRSWPLVFPWKNSAHLILAILLTLGVAWKAWDRRQSEIRLQEAAGQAQAERVEAAEEVIKDWEDFVKVTDDPGLKKLFSEAAQLRESVRTDDLMAVMLAMNRIEAKMATLRDTIASESLSPQAARMAEAFEAFEGMGAMSAAVRNRNFESASKEAEKLGAKLEKDPGGISALRRGEAVAEMLAAESSTAQKRGNTSLSDALSKLSSAASQNASKGSVPNQQISPGLDSLKNQFSSEARRKNSGRMLSIGRSQLDNLRKKLRGEPCDGPPSLCKACQGDKPGGNKAGTGTDGQPLGDPTKLAEAGQSDKVAGTMGEGESETVTTSASSGSTAAAAASTKTGLAEYIELSEKAVADESLPLAHRRAIRVYFERIRPVAESNHP